MKKIITQAFDLPFVFPSLNVWSNWHWVKRRKISGQYKIVIAAIIKDARIKPVGGMAHITVYYFYKRRPSRWDPDNYQPKWILDTLVKITKTLKDDSDKYLYPVDVHCYPKNDKEDKTTVIIKAALREN